MIPKPMTATAAAIDIAARGFAASFSRTPMIELSRDLVYDPN
jgi:hypothetical protein